MDAKWIEQALKRPESFGLHSHPHKGEMFKTWGVGPIVKTRDSDILERANYKALKRALREEGFEDEEDFVWFDANHWAVGWVRHLSFRVLDADGEPSAIARWLKGWFDALSDYPVADETLYSEMEWEQFHSRIPDAFRDMLRGSDQELTDAQEDAVLDWFQEHRGEEMSEDGYEYPSISEEMLEDALDALWPGRCREFPALAVAADLDGPDCEPLPWRVAFTRCEAPT